MLVCGIGPLMRIRFLLFQESFLGALVLGRGLRGRATIPDRGVL